MTSHRLPPPLGAMNATPFSGIDGSDHAVLLLHGLVELAARIALSRPTFADEGLCHAYAGIARLQRRHRTSADGAMDQRGRRGVRPARRTASAAVSICGLSMGATLAAAVAHERLAARALLLLSITLNYDGLGDSRIGFLLDYVAITRALRSRYRYREQELLRAAQRGVALEDRARCRRTTSAKSDWRSSACWRLTRGRAALAGYEEAQEHRHRLPDYSRHRRRNLEAA